MEMFTGIIVAVEKTDLTEESANKSSVSNVIYILPVCIVINALYYEKT